MKLMVALTIAGQKYALTSEDHLELLKTEQLPIVAAEVTAALMADLKEKGVL